MNEHTNHTGHPIDRLDAYVDGELIPAEREQVEEHLSACAACRAFVDEAVEVGRLMAMADELPAMASATAFWRELEPRLPARRADLGLGWVWGGAMVAAVHLVQAVALALLATLFASRLGLPVGTWFADSLAPAAQLSSAIVGPDLVTGLDRAAALVAGPVPIDLALVLALNAAAALVTVGLACGFLGWSLAVRRRRLDHVVVRTPA